MNPIYELEMRYISEYFCNGENKEGEVNRGTVFLDVSKISAICFDSMYKDPYRYEDNVLITLSNGPAFSEYRTSIKNAEKLLEYWKLYISYEKEKLLNPIYNVIAERPKGI